MAFTDLHEGVLEEFAQRAAPAVARFGGGRHRQASDRVDRLTLAIAEREQARKLLRRMADLRYLARWPERRAATVKERIASGKHAEAMRCHYAKHAEAKRADALRRYYEAHEENKRRQRERAAERRRAAGVPLRKKPKSKQRRTKWWPTTTEDRSSVRGRAA